MAASFLLTLLHQGGSAMLVLLAVLGVTGEEEVVIVEVSELAVKQTVTLQLLS